MTGTETLAAAVALPFAGAVALRLWPRDLSARDAGLVATLISLAALALVVPDLVPAFEGEAATLVLPWIPTLDVAFALRLDGLAGLFSLLVAGIGTVVFAYAAGYMEGHDRVNAFFATMLAFQGSMLGVVLADDVLLLFLFWELTSLTSFLLIGTHRDEPDAVYSARKAMVITVAGGVVLFTGLLALAMLAGTLRVGAIVAAPLGGEPLLPVALGLVVAGAAAKAAQFPLHIWLPDAMVAPTPVSSYLHSAAMVKAGIYAIARFRPLGLATTGWPILVTGLGLVTMLVTAILALGQRDPKKLLAYSTCSQLGLIVAALGIPHAADGAVLHVAHHAVFKCGLFLVAGIAIHAFHAETMDEMGGLARVMPVTGTVALFLALASAGVPPFSAFISKEIVLEALLVDPGLGAAGALVVFAFASMFTVAYSVRFFEGIFLGDLPDGVETPTITTRAPAMLLGVLALLGGIAPDLWDGLTGGALAAVHPGAQAPHLALWHGVTPGLAISGVIVVGGLGLFGLRPTIQGWVERLGSTEVRATADHAYHALLDACQGSAFRVGRLVQRETPQAYVAYTVLGAVGLAALGLVSTGASLAVPAVVASPPVILVAGLVAVAALTVPLSRGYTLGIVALAAVGLLIGLLYLLVGAPDVGLTQLLVETLILVLFVAVVGRLPPTYASPPASRRLRDAAIATLAGATLTVLVLLATSPSALPHLGPAYLDVVVELAGGHNAVNVILVDFRALDTLGEITVVAVAGLAGITLVQGRVRGWLS